MVLLLFSPVFATAQESSLVNTEDSQLNALVKLLKAFMLIFLAIPEDAVLQDVKMTSTPTYIPPTETIVGFTAVLLGLGDSGFNTQIMGILGLLYKVSYRN